MQDRPALGFEYEVALAKINVANDLTFADSTYPAIVGEFEVITCTKDIRCVPPVNQIKAIANGYNPAALLIPAPTIVGRFSFESHDTPHDDHVLAYNGFPCVVRLRCVQETDVERLWYCCYWNGALDYHAPEGDAVGSVSGDGFFTLLNTATP